MANQQSPLGPVLDRHHEKLKNNRSLWERQWQDISEYVLPHRSDFTTTHSRGAERMDMAFEGSAMRLLKRFASNIHNVFTPMGAEWFKLSSGHTNLDKDRNVALWIEEATKIIQHHMSRPISNFQSAVFQYYLEAISKEEIMKKLLTLIFFGSIFGQELPQPAILGEDLRIPTIKISEFVKVEENTGIKDDRITMGVRQLLEEAFSDSRYQLIADDNADFVASAEIVWVGRPDEAFSIIGLFSRRKSETEVRMNVLVSEIATDKIISSRGVGTIQTDISAAGLQIEEELPFNQSEFGGAIRKAIDEAMKQYK